MSSNDLDILQFLEHYQQHPCLWDKCHPDYKNRQIREEAERVFLEMTGLDNIKVLRAKIRSIRGTYNNELRKIRKSEASVSGQDKVYEPKLRWFYFANSFLSKNIEDELAYESSVTFIEIPNIFEQENEDEAEKRGKRVAVNALECTVPSKSSRVEPNPIEISNVQSLSQTQHGKRTSQKTPGGLLKSASNSRGDDCLRPTCQTLKMIHKDSSKEFGVFGQSVGLQLSRLPIRTALQLQLDIQTMLTKARLSALESGHTWKRVSASRSPAGSLSPEHQMIPSPLQFLASDDSSV